MSDEELRRTPEEMATLWRQEAHHLMRQLANPPRGWLVFGHHATPEWDGKIPDLEFWGDDGTGLPIWERPKGVTE